MAEPRRTFRLTLVVGVLAVYGLLAAEISHSNYLLVSDYIDLTLIHGGFWPQGILDGLVNPFAPGAWLYRPFADTMSYLLALLMEKHVGGWHVILIFFRLISVLLAWLTVREFTTSVVASCVAVAYFAFFPAIPEIDLTRVETYLMVTLAAAFYGYLRVARGAASTATCVMTGIAFVCVTMSKEVVAPLALVLLGFATPILWRRRAIGRWVLLAMALAMVNQGIRFLLLASEPYAQGEERVLAKQFIWTAKVLVLAVTNVPIVPLLLLAWGGLGLWAMWQARHPRLICAVALLALSIAMAVLAPYPAIRYLSPASFFLVPLLASGVAQSRLLAKPVVMDVAAFATMILIITFGGAQILAQASSMRNSTGADWRLLRYAATAYASGRNVYMIEDYDFERAFWVRGELVGVDARWPFISYAHRQSLAGRPIDWPRPPSGPVNLTGLVPSSHPRGRFATVRPPYRFEPGSLVIPANPGVTSIAASVTKENVLDSRGESALTLQLVRFERVARTLNPKFRYLYDLGESPFPGHFWVTFTAR